MATARPGPDKTWIETPLIESAAISRAAGCRIFLKLENLQPSGAFKSRGVGNYILRHLEKYPPNTGTDPNKNPAKAHFYSSSGGNAGLAAVVAARDLDHPATVVVPLATSELMISKIKTAGATDVIRHGASWRDADTYLRDVILAKDPNGVYVPPFDHPDIWAGNSTIVPELYRQLTEIQRLDAAKDYSGTTSKGSEPDAIICSVGGGGLFVGMQIGLENAGWSHVPVIPVETKGAESLHASLEKGELITLPGITSQATTLGAVRVAEQAFKYGQRPNVHNVVLSDAEAAIGCYRLANDERILAELACGVNLALCYDREKLKDTLRRAGKELNKNSKVVVILCGGSNVTVEMLQKWKEEYGTPANLA